MNIKQETQKINLKLDLKKVKQLDLAYQDTLVILYQDAYNKAHDIYHIEQDGSIIKKYSHKK